jgi:hypothetical protein
MPKRKYISGHIESQPEHIEREMREILGIEAELGRGPKKRRR